MPGMIVAPQPAAVEAGARVLAAGGLSLVVSGPEETWARVEPLLAHLGKGATYVGEGDVARLAKICHNLMLGVVSGALREEVEGALRQESLLAHFKVLVTADEVQRSKPDPEGYQLGLEGLNSRPPLPGRLIHPHEALAIEDSPAGIEAAATLGMTTLAVAQTYGAGQLSGADVVVGSVAELNAERLCELYDCLG